MIDGKLHMQVALGAGGVSQELWIFAPATIQERERVIIQSILTYGIIPTYLKSKQLILLPKGDNMPDVIDLRQGTPNYRLIMIQAALSNRLQQVIKQYVK